MPHLFSIWFQNESIFRRSLVTSRVKYFISLDYHFHHHYYHFLHPLYFSLHQSYFPHPYGFSAYYLCPYLLKIVISDHYPRLAILLILIIQASPFILSHLYMMPIDDFIFVHAQELFPIFYKNNYYLKILTFDFLINTFRDVSPKITSFVYFIISLCSMR